MIPALPFYAFRYMCIGRFKLLNRSRRVCAGRICHNFSRLPSRLEAHCTACTLLPAIDRAHVYMERHCPLVHCWILVQRPGRKPPPPTLSVPRDVTRTLPIWIGLPLPQLIMAVEDLKILYPTCLPALFTPLITLSGIGITGPYDTHFL